MLKEMEDGGLQVTKPDKAAFAAKAKTAHEAYAKTVDMELYREILQAIGR